MVYMNTEPLPKTPFAPFHPQKSNEMAGGAVLVPTDGRKLTLREKLPPKHVVYPFALVTSLFFLCELPYYSPRSISH
jgi:hypothetical protein